MAFLEEVSLGVGFVISLPRGCPAQLPAAMLSTMMVMDSNALEPSPQIKHFFSIGCLHVLS